MVCSVWCVCGVCLRLVYCDVFALACGGCYCCVAFWLLRCVVFVICFVCCMSVRCFSWFGLSWVVFVFALLFSFLFLCVCLSRFRFIPFRSVPFVVCYRRSLWFVCL